MESFSLAERVAETNPMAATDMTAVENRIHFITCLEVVNIYVLYTGNYNSIILLSGFQR